MKRFELARGGLLLFDDAFMGGRDANAAFAELSTSIPWSQGHVRIAGKTYAEPRLTAWFGDADASYTYSGKALVPLPWTPLLAELRERIEALGRALDATNPPPCFNSVLLNFYRDGNDSMGFHADSEKELGPNPIIASVSLGAARRFILRYAGPAPIGAEAQKAAGKARPVPDVELDLGNGSLLWMLGTTQHFWKHGVPKRRGALGARINLTFRAIVTRDSPRPPPAFAER